MADVDQGVEEQEPEAEAEQSRAWVGSERSAASVWLSGAESRLMQPQVFRTRKVRACVHSWRTTLKLDG